MSSFPFSLSFLLSFFSLPWAAHWGSRQFSVV